MRDHWIDGLLVVATIGSLYWTLTQMAQQLPFGVGLTPDREDGSADTATGANTTTAIAPPAPGLILGSDQPVDEDPDFDIDMEDLGAIATFEQQRL